MIHELVLPILLAFKSGISASIDGVEDSDVTWVTARVLSDHNGSLDSLLREFRGSAQHLFILGLLFTLILAEFFGHFIDCKALTLDPHKNLTFIEETLVIDNTNKYS